jgi:hypothetical protein
MSSRFAVAVLVAISSAHIGYAQQVVSDVVVSGASLNDGFGGVTCVDGQLYRFGGHLDSVMRVAQDGSTLMFQLPHEQWPFGPSAITPAATGLDIMSAQHSGAKFIGYEMYHFDTQGNLLAQNQVFIDFSPTEVAVMSSGNTMVFGHHQPEDPSHPDHKYYGAVLDADDHIIKRFELPLPAGGGGWTPRSRMVAGDGVAYVVLKSDTGEFAIATISETGHIEVKTIPVPPDTDQRHHATWLTGPGIAVDVYQYVGEKPPGSLHFDEYDLNTGQKVATRSSPGVGFTLACYSGSEFSMLAHSAHVDPARHLSPDTLRLVTVKLH